ncbi:MAG: SCO family protein [Alphaproteobacteria bacterium]|nr:SCO family protein [Alphaproteobacteria bacterium]
MNTTIKKRLMRTVILCAIAMAIGVGAAYTELKSRHDNMPPPVAGVSVGGPFALTDHTGKDVTQEAYAGQYKLIYFGFTYCPAICPTELQKITKVLNILGDEGDDIQPLFITIDPERDTVDTMRGYVSLFHPRLIGLTGNRAQIDKVLANYRVFAQKVEDPENNDYTMDHSSFIYLMSPDDTLISIYRIQDDADYIAADIAKKL